jgi:putative ABC transport system ATP-binding protein
MMIAAKNMVKTYGSGEGAVHAVREMSLAVGAGEFAVVMGESGSGKSTLLSLLGALNTPSAGSYEVDGIDVYRLGSEKRADFRREYLGFIFQSFHLIPYLSIAENVMLPLATTKLSAREKRSLADEALEKVGLGNKGNRLPSQVSGGEAERTAIARAIVNRPPILLADEPTGNLDSRTSKDVMALLEELNKQGMTVIMVTHSAECATHGRRLIRVSDGLIVEDRSTAKTLQS